MISLQDLNSKEEEVLAYWKENRILEKVRARNKSRKPYYFLDGPPFVSGDLHPAQIWTKTMKDVAVRYKRYRGFNVVDRAGYDVHGLPVENRLEKELGVQSKKDIEEKIGVEKFVNECRAYVEKYIGRMDADYERFGISLDFKNPYLPYKNEYIETAWGMFKKASENGFLYKGKRTLIYCPHCETPLSQGSMEVEYRDVDDPSIYVAFRIDEKRSRPGIALPPDSYLVIWTTTPWTLPANVSVAANPKNTYVMVNAAGKNMIIAKERLAAFEAVMKESLVIINEFQGSELHDIYYISPLEAKVPKQAELRKYHRVIFSESLVSMGEGTGLVHMAPGNGVDDYAVGKLNKLPIFSPVNPDATYNEDAGVYKGIKVPTDANKAVLEDLEASGALLNRSSIRHSYPFCWRCSSKLIFLATDQWFMNVQRIKKKLVRQNERVNWHPQEVKGWQKAVLENSPDWCISRQRYWGIPMPIWVCGACKKMKVIGSAQELRENATNQEEALNLRDLHRPYIDKIKLKCECGGSMERTRDILDGWFDSGITFRASLTEEQFKEFFPVDLIVEYIEQIRAWFQYLMKCGVMVYGKIPFRNAMVHGIMAGTDGRKMSKSFGNFRPLNEITRMFTADAFRLWSIDHQPILNRNLNEAEIKESGKIISVLYNISNLLSEYADMLGIKLQAKPRAKSVSLDEIDAWIVSRTESIIYSVTEHLEKYEAYRAASELRNFILEDFSRFYLKIAKKRLLYGSRGQAAEILGIANYVLYNVLLLTSVITPFSSESIYLERYRRSESIFLEKWPQAKQKAINKELEVQMGIAKDAITALLNSREKANITLRWPISKAIIEVRDDVSKAALERLSGIVKDAVNAKELELKRIKGASEEVRPVFSRLGPVFKDKASAIAEALKKSDPNEMRSQVEKAGRYALRIGAEIFEIKPDQFAILELKGEGDAVAFSHGSAYIDRNISRELKEEALVREFERRVQLLRKKLELKKPDKIELLYKASPGLSGIVASNKQQIARNLNAKEIREAELPEDSESFDIEGEALRLQVRKL